MLRHATRLVLIVLVPVLAPNAFAGQDVLWHVSQPSGSTYGTSYSTVYSAGFANDTEVADDFEATGLVERVFVNGRGCGQCTTPIVDGVFVRFYEWTSDGPGALQHEAFVAGDDPDFVWNGVYPYTLDITLPEPFAVSGWHFVSVQVAFGATGGVWNFVQANRVNPINAPVQFRDNLAGGVWEQDHFFSTPINADVAITLYGQAAPALPVIDSISKTAFTGSDRITVHGSSFGAPGNGALLIGGLPALVTNWAATQITAYTPEGVAPGPASLNVVNLGITSAPMAVTVQPRTADGQVRWVFEGDGDYASFAPAIGPDGTIYFDDVDGNLYAINADGALLWIVDSLLGQPGTGSEGPVGVGTDGTIYVGTNPLGPTVELVAFNPDGTHRWTFTASDALTWQAGPSLGPDGRIYGALNAAQLLGQSWDVFAVNPDGTAAWTTAADPVVFEDAARGSAVAFGPSSPGGPIDQMLFTADGNGDGRNWGFDLADGDQNFATPTAGGNDVGQTQLVADAATGAFYMMEFTGLGGAGWGLQSFAGDGARTWRFDPGIASGATHPALGPDGTIFFGWDLGRLSAVTPGGDEIWTVFEPVIYQAPAPSPTEPMFLAIGRVSYNQPSFVEARDTGSGALLWAQTLVDDDGGDVAIDSKARFAPDGQRAYFSTVELPITPTSTFRIFAVDAVAQEPPGATGDLNGSGAVDFADVLVLLAAWGPCGGTCPADLDGDGTVAFADLLIVLANWG